jgi:tRNA pseudouridine38-40 synthase
MKSNTKKHIDILTAMGMGRLLIAFSYDGTRFTGFQRGNGERSVEGSINQCVAEFDLGSKIRCASRTDRNVSALNNFMTVDTVKKPENILGILNSHISGAVFHSYSPVDEKFNVRHSVRKTYAYILSPGSYPESGLMNTLKKFEGQHDFAHFSRPEGKPTVRTIDRIWLSEISGFPAIFFMASGFLWNQIRFIMGYALNRREDQGDPFLDDLRILAPPHNLILVDITYENVNLKPFRSGSVSRRVYLERERMRNSYIFYNELNIITRKSSTDDL